MEGSVWEDAGCSVSDEEVGGTGCEEETGGGGADDISEDSPGSGIEDCEEITSLEEETSEDTIEDSEEGDGSRTLEVCGG